MTVGPMFFAPSGVASNFLDSLSVLPRVACSIDAKIISTATKSVRVRRSSDNAEQDIGFVGNAFDTTALTTFVGSGNGFVSKFYDQTGHGFDIVYATGQQPKIVNAGSYLGYIQYDGTTSGGKITGMPFGTPYCQHFGRVQMSTAAGVMCLFEMGPRVDTDTAGVVVVFQYATFGGWTVDSYNAGSGTDRGQVYVNDAAMHVWSFLVARDQTGAGEFVVRKDSVGQSVASTLASTEQTGNFAARDVFVGCRNLSSNFASMNQRSFVLYDAAANPIQASIEAKL